MTNEASTVRASDFPRADWRKSIRSNHGGEGDCVEIAELPGRVATRDSKDPAGPVLASTRAQWRTFLGGIQTGEFSGPSPPWRRADLDHPS